MRGNQSSHTIRKLTFQPKLPNRLSNLHHANLARHTKSGVRRSLLGLCTYMFVLS